MNERTLRDRFHALGPLVLRVGIALVLLSNGLERSTGLFQQESVTSAEAGAAEPAKTAAAMSLDGLRFSADWAVLLGVGEVLTAGLLLIGLATRLVVLPVLAVLGYGLYFGFPQASLPTNTMAMLFLAAGCGSLLVSGGGSFALRRRRHVLVFETPPTVERVVQRREPVHAGPSLTQRVRHWFGRRWPARHPVQPAAAAPGKRWPWR